MYNINIEMYFSQYEKYIKDLLINPNFHTTEFQGVKNAESE
jgi:hypothetical protein